MTKKKTYNYHLNKWKRFEKLVYPKILDKSASLYVIYDNDELIAVTLNFHIKNVIFPEIVTYDINYSKFRLGHVLWHYFIEWCFENNTSIMDLSVGNFPYLKKLANKNYISHYHVFYTRYNIISFSSASAALFKLKFKQFVRDKNLHLIFRTIVGKIKSKTTKSDLTPKHSIIPYEGSINSKECIKIDLRKNSGTYPKRLVFDLLYKNSDNIDEIDVFMHNNKSDFFYIGKTKNYKISTKL